MRVLPEMWDSKKNLYSFAETNAISSNENENREFEVEKTYPCKSTKFCHKKVLAHTKTLVTTANYSKIAE